MTAFQTRTFREGNSLAIKFAIRPGLSAERRKAPDSELGFIENRITRRPGTVQSRAGNCAREPDTAAFRKPDTGLPAFPCPL
jgi:hypothetical protein